jgi:hypothetical protein
MTDSVFMFPHVDPIPLPAPVWLFKVLHNLTLSLHFAFLHLLIGGLLLALLWNLLGHLRGSKTMIGASAAVAAKLPIVTTYVINLGVPPLLFSQVLYGQALYSSSILIGAWWISVLALVMAAYSILYRMALLAEKGRSFWPWALIALFPIALVGKLFSTNMTLMLRPEAWLSMYAANASGTHLPPHDPAMLPRFLVMMIGSLALGALGTSLWSLKSTLPSDVRIFLRHWSGLFALIFLPALGFAAAWAFRAQPLAIRQGLESCGYGHFLLQAWPIAWAACILAAITLLAGRRLAWTPVAASIPAFATVVFWTLARDQVRDLTLISKGLDVWKNPVHSNWTVVVLFLAALMIGLAVLGWVALLLARATATEGTHA